MSDPPPTTRLPPEATGWPFAPKETHRARAEFLRTAAAIATLCLTIGLFLSKVGIW